jgi:hypothetical protein
MPFDCPQAKQGSSTNNRGSSPVSERLANHISGSEPAMAKTVENVRERIMPWTFRRPHVNRHETWGSYPPTRVTGTARLIRACGVLLVDGDNAIHFGTFSRPASDLDR